MQDFHREYLAFLSIQKEGLHRISNPESSSNFKGKEFALNSAVIIESRFPRARHFPESDWRLHGAPLTSAAAKHKTEQRRTLSSESQCILTDAGILIAT